MSPDHRIEGNSSGHDAAPNRRSRRRRAGRCRLANTLEVERYYDADRKAMLAALRVVLWLPKPLPGTSRRANDGQ